MKRFETKKAHFVCMLILSVFISILPGCGGSDNSVPVGTSPVSSSAPANAATGVPLNNKLTVTFSKAMDPATINGTTFTVKQGQTAVPGTVTYSGVTAVFTPTSNLAASTVYTATITTGAKDLTGKALTSDYVMNFTTGAVADTTAPTVATTVPVNAATTVSVGNKLTVTFGKVMDPATITGSTFTLMQGQTAVPGTVTYTGVSAVFTPTGILAASTVYTATITTGAKDLAGNAMSSNYVWSFTTGAAGNGPAPVNLGTAGNYVILAKSAISTTGVTAVTGNLGLSPAAATAITGFSLTVPPTTFSTSPLVTGQIFAADYDPPTPTILTTAVLDMQTAYTDAAGRAPDHTELGNGNIGGMTLAPGVYKWGTGVLIPTDVTLSGGPNDVWIFEIAQNLVMSSATHVKLIGGAQAKNIFWQVFGIVDLGTAAHFEGIALVQTAITLKTGATVNGRLLAQTAVSLDASTVTVP